VRIIAGKRRGLALAAVGKGDAAAHLRPTSDRVRESLFNLLLGGRYGNPVADARVLDLFAGTGALGLEAWSRGAGHVTFVDDGAAAQALIRANVTKAQAGAETDLLRRDATRLGDRQGPAFDLVFLDPPYGKGLGTRALAAARDGGWIAPDALIVWEENAAQDAPAGFDAIETRRYGDTHVTLMRAVTPPDASEER
jgi:16S rRNA (guanine966-N2)-methyltransferase